MNDFNFFIPLSKVEKNGDGSCTVSGYASTPALDMDNEIISLDAIRKALPGYMQWRNIREMHTSTAVGVAKEANIDDKGLFLTAKVIDKSAVEKCLEGVYKGFSIGGRKLNKSGNTITAIDLVEISVVDRPANPECKFEVQKSAKPDAVAYLAKLSKPFRDPRTRALGQMAKAVQTLAKAPEAVEKAAAPKLCKVHDKAACPDCTCDLHKTVDCAKCAAAKAAVTSGLMTPNEMRKKLFGKRDVSSKERKRLAGEGEALPDGSFPIANRSDLANARQAVGRAKDPSAARAHIKRRAKDLGVKLPDSWSKKLAKSLIAARESELLADVARFDLTKSATPSFLTLNADGGEGTVGGEHGSGHELVLDQGGGQDLGLELSKRERKLLKSMGIAGQLSYCFDSVRSAQRQLMMEAQREGGDKKDEELASKLGTLAQGMAAVIGQKAEHEGAEALDFSDADDQGFLSLIGKDSDMPKSAGISNDDAIVKAVLDMMKAGKAPTRAGRLDMAKEDLKKARNAAKDMEECVKAAHGMLKSAYLAKQAFVKAGKKNDNDADDMDTMGKVMSELQKAFGTAQGLKTAIKSASVQVKKASARAGQRGQEVSDPEPGVYEVPSGIRDLSPQAMATAGPGSPNVSGSEPPILGLETPFPGKMAKALKKGGYISAEVAEMLVANAKLEAENELLKATPTGPVHGQRPVLFDVNKLGGNKGAGNELLKGIDPAALKSEDEEVRKNAVGTVIGRMLLTGTGARPIMDPNFHGTAG